MTRMSLRPMIPKMPRALLLWLALLALACGEESSPDTLPEEGQPTEAPFAVRGDAEGLLLVWFDEEGQHTAHARSEIPESARERVRVDDLSLPPGERLDPDLVYVADLRAPDGSGDYAVRTFARTRFEALVAAAAPPPPEPVAAPTAVAAGDPNADVIIYGASWCNACRGAASFLRSRNIAFVERDVEREPGAREAMMRAASAAGVRPSGIPVIDFRGQIIAGFDRGALERAIAAGGPPASAGSAPI